MSDLPHHLNLNELERLTSVTLRAICHAHGSPTLAFNARPEPMMEFLRSIRQAQGVQPWRQVREAFVLKLRALVAAQISEQQGVHREIEEAQRCMAEETARITAAMAAVDASANAEPAADADGFASSLQLFLSALDPGNCKLLSMCVVLFSNMLRRGQNRRGRVFVKKGGRRGSSVDGSPRCQLPT